MSYDFKQGLNKMSLALKKPEKVSPLPRKAKQVTFALPDEIVEY